MSKSHLEGQRFGRLTAIEYIGESRYRCKCDCGKFTDVKTCNLTNGHTKSCGCIAKNQSAINGKKLRCDLTGQRYGKLTVVCYADDLKKWKCKCDCGNICYVTANNLLRKNGGTKSCGCLVSLDKANRLNIVEGTNVGNIKRKEALPNSKTQIKGVHYSSSMGLYFATIGFKGKQYTLATSKNISVCIAARKEAEKMIYGDFLEWYENWKNQTNGGNIMTYEELKRKGTFVNEEDRYSRGIYTGTSYYYVYDDDLYVREEHTNLNSYTGETGTYILLDRIAEALKEYNCTYFKQMMSEETYEKLCEVCNTIANSTEN